MPSAAAGALAWPCNAVPAAPPLPAVPTAADAVAATAVAHGMLLFSLPVCIPLCSCALPPAPAAAASVLSRSCTRTHNLCAQQHTICVKSRHAQLGNVSYRRGGVHPHTMHLVAAVSYGKETHKYRMITGLPGVGLWNVALAQLHKCWQQAYNAHQLFALVSHCAGCTVHCGPVTRSILIPAPKHHVVAVQGTCSSPVGMPAGAH